MHQRLTLPAVPAAFAAMLLVVSDGAFAQVTEDLELLPASGQAGDVFGSSVAMEGGLVVLGAPHDDDAAPNSGSVYLFHAATGTQHAKLVAADPSPGAEFGSSVAIADGLVVVGARYDDDHGPGSGSAYIFDAATGAQLHKLTASDGAVGDEFGFAVAIADGVVAVGAKRDDDNGTDSGSIYLFDALTGAQTHKVLPLDGSANDNFGEALDVDGGIIAVGAHGDWANGPLSGSAYLFDASTGAQLHKLVPLDGSSNDFFGQSIAIDDGVVVVGAWADSIVFDHSGSAYLFDAATGSQTAKIVPAGGHDRDHFGISVAIDAGTVTIGADGDDDAAFGAGSVYVYEASTASFVAKLLASDGAALDEFGAAVATQSGTVVATAPRADDLGSASGAAYLFRSGACAAPEPYCTSTTNSSGTAATMGALGSPSIAADDLELTCSGCPGSTFGLFFHGPDPQQSPFGSGFLCVAGALVRTPIVQTTATGTASLALDVSAAPGVAPDATRHFQFWFRDAAAPGGSGFNTSDALRVRFCD